jgi:hypothetical protein
MNDLLIATMKVDAAYKQHQRRLSMNVFPKDDEQFQIGVRRGLEDAYEILVEQLREAQPDVVKQLTQIRAIVNKM